jgi:putative acetyltransferase
MTSDQKILVVEVDPNIEAARKLVAALDEYMAARYPAESNHLDGVAELAAPPVTFVVAYLEGQALGCGAVKDMNGEYGEIKRLYVAPPARGFGLAKAIMSYLEKKALARGLTTLRLETGAQEPAAIGLYHKLGYERIGPFGDYRHDPLSVFMEKRLA